MTHITNALIFAAELPPAGARGSLQVQLTGLTVSVQERTWRVPLASLQLRTVGFGTPGVELSWHEQAEPCAAHVLDAAQASALLSLPQMAALPQVQALKFGRRKANAGRTLGWSLLGLVVLLPLILLALLVMQADRLAGWVTNRIPIEQEVKLGEQSFAQMKGQLKLLDAGAAHAAVQTLGKQLTQGSRYTYQFHVVADDTLNAFALPGGIVVVHDGLIKATKRPEELAGVLAHEVQHVELRHSLKGLVKNAGLTIVWGLVTGDVGGTLAGQAALQLTSLKFSRDAETEADAKGFDVLVNKGIDPSGMPDFFKTMSEKAADAPVAFMSTHPLSKQREAVLQQRVASLPQHFTKLELGTWPPQ